MDEMELKGQENRNRKHDVRNLSYLNNCFAMDPWQIYHPLLFVIFPMFIKNIVHSTKAVLKN